MKKFNKLLSKKNTHRTKIALNKQKVKYLDKIDNTIKEGIAIKAGPLGLKLLNIPMIIKYKDIIEIINE